MRGETKGCLARKMGDKQLPSVLRLKGGGRGEEGKRVRGEEGRGRRGRWEEREERRDEGEKSKGEAREEKRMGREV